MSDRMDEPKEVLEKSESSKNSYSGRTIVNDLFLKLKKMAEEKKITFSKNGNTLTINNIKILLRISTRKGGWSFGSISKNTLDDINAVLAIVFGPDRNDPDINKYNYVFIEAEFIEADNKKLTRIQSSWNLSQEERTSLKKAHPELYQYDEAPTTLDELCERVIKAIRYLPPGTGKQAKSHPAAGSSASLLDLLEKSRNVILYGPPGTGKTRMARKAAWALVHPKTDAARSNSKAGSSEDNAGSAVPGEQIRMVQFHPSYSYFDFVEGMEADPDGSFVFHAKSKIFRQLCETATNDPDRKYVLIIDEINRADVSSVLGELLYGLEYRGEPIDTPLTGESLKPLCVPENLYIIGTMNTADQSIASMDYAVRRRFSFLFVPSRPYGTNQDDASGKHYFALDVYKQVRKDIEAFVARGVQAEDIMPGMSYFLIDLSEDDLSEDKKKLAAQGVSDQLVQAVIDHINYKICYELLPLLAEYARNGLLSKRKTTESGYKLIEQIRNGDYKKRLLGLIQNDDSREKIRTQLYT